MAKPGLCLTFDDLFVENWCAMRPLFDQCQARATFCVSHLHEATPAQLQGLRDLQADGHEISFHTRTHPKLTRYLNTHGLDHWLEHEIDAGIAEHRSMGFPATSFATPFHASTPAVLEAVALRFKTVRTGTPGVPTPGRLARRILQPPLRTPVVYNVGYADAQLSAFPGWHAQIGILDAVVQRQGIGVFAGHDISKQRSGQGYYAKPRQILRLMQIAQARGLAFYTLSALADL